MSNRKKLAADPHQEAARRRREESERRIKEQIARLRSDPENPGAYLATVREEAGIRGRETARRNRAARAHARAQDREKRSGRRSV